MDNLFCARWLPWLLMILPPSLHASPMKGGRIGLELRATFSPAHPLADIFSPALPSDCFAIDFPGRAMNPGEGLPIFPTLR